MFLFYNSMIVEQFNRARELEDVVQKNVETRYLHEVDKISNGLRNNILDEMISCADGKADLRTASMQAVRVLSEWKMFANAINKCVKNGDVTSLRKVKEVLIDSASMLKKEGGVVNSETENRGIKEDEEDTRGKSLEKMFGKDMYNAVNTVANQLRNDMMAGMVPRGFGFGSAWPKQSLESWKMFGEAMRVRHADGSSDDATLIKNVMSGAVKRLMQDIQTGKKQEVVRK